MNNITVSPSFIQ